LPSGVGKTYQLTIFKPSIFRFFDGCIAGDQCHANGLGVGRYHDVKCSCTSPEALGTHTKSGLRLDGLFIPSMNRNPREEGPYGRPDGRAVLSRRAP
jgi:hypothetical protein